MQTADVVYLTIGEAAERFRVSPQTIYRWCRSGRLEAVKVGKAWRIAIGQPAFGPQAERLAPLDVVLSSVMGRSEHLVALAGDNADLSRLETALFQTGAQRGALLVHGLWEEEETQLRRTLRPGVAGARGGRGGLFRLLDVTSAYEEAGNHGVAEAWLETIREAETNRVLCCMYGAPLAYFGLHLTRLAAYESELGEHLRGEPAVLVCGYALADLMAMYGERALSVIIDLIGVHTGILWYDGQRALLLRLPEPAGPKLSTLAGR